MNEDVGGSKSISNGVDEFDDIDMEKTTVLDSPDDIDDEALEETVVLDDDVESFTDNVGDVSVEINVEELIADIEGNSDGEAARRREVRRRLEEAVEDRSLEDTYAIDLGENSD